MKDFVFKAMNATGLAGLSRLLNRNKDICLMYHAVVPDHYPIESWLYVKESRFRDQMDFIRTHWEVLSLDSYFSGESRSHKPKAIVTFDDGYRNNYSVAFPILKRFGIPSTIYIVTDCIGTERLFWFDRVIYAVQRNGISSLSLPETLNNGASAFSFAESGASRWVGLQALLDWIKTFPANDAEAIATEIWKILDPVQDHTEMLKILDGNQIDEMHRSGLVEIGSHTSKHEILTLLDRPGVTMTLESSSKALERITGSRPGHFSYPNGDFSPECADQVAAAGYRSAVTTESGFLVQGKTPEYRIPRMSIGGYESNGRFKARMSGITGPMRKPARKMP